MKIHFDPAATYHTGEYWQIPARAATASAPSGDIDWPRKLDSSGKPDNNSPLPQPPQGIRHHYCRVGIVKLDDQGHLEFTDCRCLFLGCSGFVEVVMNRPPSAT